MLNASFQCFFPPPPVLLIVFPVNWRARLRDAIERSGKKHSAVARDAGVAPETLSRILNDAHPRPSFDLVVRIAHAVNENVGWLVDERGFSLSFDEQRQLRKVVRFLDDALVGPTVHRRDRPEPNAQPTGATDIPRVYTTQGARLAYEIAGDAMVGAGILDRDVLFVKPTRNAREATGQVVVCRIDDEQYVRHLDMRGGRVRLLSRNSRFPPIDIAEDSTRFELIGIVVGRTGALG